MDPAFKQFVEMLHPSFERLMEMVPLKMSSLPSRLPDKCIYLFSEGQNYLYVGRTRNLRKRLRQHSIPSAQHNQAVFAFKLARETTGRLTADYSAQGSRKALCIEPAFAEAFLQAKSRVRKMDLRFVEEEDPTRQGTARNLCLGCSPYEVQRLRYPLNRTLQYRSVVSGVSSFRPTLGIAPRDSVPSALIGSGCTQVCCRGFFRLTGLRRVVHRSVSSSLPSHSRQRSARWKRDVWTANHSPNDCSASKLRGVKEKVLCFLVAASVTEAMSVILDVRSDAHGNLLKQRHDVGREPLGAADLGLISRCRKPMCRIQILLSFTKIQSMSQFGGYQAHRAAE